MGCYLAKPQREKGLELVSLKGPSSVPSGEVKARGVVCMCVCVVVGGVSQGRSM